MSWTINGISGRGDPPSCANQFSGPAVVLGSARCLWDDLERIGPDFAFLAVNFGGSWCTRPVQHWCSLHPEYIPSFMLPSIHRNTYRGHVWTHTQKPSKDAQIAWDLNTGRINMGTSGMFAVMVALALGYSPVVLAGMPIDNSGHFYDPPGAKSEFNTAIDSWKRDEVLKAFQGRVFSLSGRTKDLLGEPPWLRK